MNMSEPSTSRLYDLWAWMYDWTFGALVRARQSRAIQQLHPLAGERVLDMGVGTGLMLNEYRPDITVVGLDISAGMLSKAAEKCVENGLTHCRLVRADAMLPPFADHSFDHIMISHTISVVSDPAKLMAWATRLLKPGGRIVLLNHFQSTWPVAAWVERVLNPMFVKIGWRSDLALEDVLRGADLDVEYCFKMRLIDVWRIVVLRRKGEVPPAQTAPVEQPAKRLALHLAR